ncbi:MAG: hypothetical protein RQ750_13860 [Roseovarius sp.]|nr:hypothetical protein [Roseovarius sp.]
MITPRSASELRDTMVLAFASESNMIEGIRYTSPEVEQAHHDFLGQDISITSLVEFVSVCQPDAILRNRPGVPCVRVGNHTAPPSGPDVEAELLRIIGIKNPWEQHCAYETLHPFTDCNGRSGRAIWLHRHIHDDHDPAAAARGFLHSWYYHTLRNWHAGEKP